MEASHATGLGTRRGMVHRKEIGQMNQFCRTTIPRLLLLALLALPTGCKHLAKVHEAQQDLAIDRRGQVVVMPLSGTVSLCDTKFDEGELEGAKDHFRELVRENLNHSLSKEITVVHPKTVDNFLQTQGAGPDQHFDKALALKMAKLMEAEIVVFGHVKVDPVFIESPLEKAKRYDLDVEVFFFDTTNDDRLATLRCAGERQRVIETIPYLIHQLRFHPPIKLQGKPAPKAPRPAPTKQASAREN